MKTSIILFSVAIAACGDSTTNVTQVMCGSGTTLMNGACVADTTCGSGTTLQDGMCVPNTPNPTYVQVEHLARPGINEALVLSNSSLEGYNATAPSFAGASAADVATITGEAKTVLQAVYYGACLLNGVVGLSASTGVHPAGAQCAAVGGAIFQENNPLTGVTLTSAAKTGAQAYADRVFAQFEPDVMRIDTGIATSGYLNLCGDPTMPQPLLCGGRWLTDDVIDITYDYLIAGAAFGASSPAQFKALVSDGVSYSVATPGAVSLSTPDPNNGNQGHPAVTNTFPYSAAPL